MRRTRPSAKAVALFVTVILVVGAGVFAYAPGARASGAHPAAGSEALTVTVGTELQFTLSTTEVTPGDNVSVTIYQTSTTAHTFTLLNATNFQFNWSSSSSDSLTHIQGFLAAHPPLVNVSIPDSVTVIHTSFIAPAFGLYEYLCLIPGHFAAGMWGILGSGESGGGAASVDTGPGAPVFIISGTIAALVVAAIVLAFVVGRREGAKHEMAPERLGYPEPTPLPTEKK